MSKFNELRLFCQDNDLPEEMVSAIWNDFAPAEVAHMKMAHTLGPPEPPRGDSQRRDRATVDHAGYEVRRRAIFEFDLAGLPVCALFSRRDPTR